MFRSCHFLLLSLPITALVGPSLTLSGSVDIRGLLSDTSAKYANYEVYDVEEGPEEDIVYVTKRAPTTVSKGCSDCDYFTPWDEDEIASLVRRGPVLPAYGEINVTQQHSPRRRATKPKNVKMSTIECPGQVSSIELQSYQYPTNEEMSKV